MDDPSFGFTTKVSWIYIRLYSADPYDKPLINPNDYQDPYDMEVTVESIKIALALSKTEAFRKLGTKFYDKPFPWL